MTKRCISTANCHEVLTVQEISEAVAEMVRSFGISGSAGSFDLYKANIAYLLDPAKRDAINRILGTRTERLAVDPA